MGKRTPEVPTISREAVLEKRQRGEPFVLIDVLPHDHFRHIHLPGAINVPVNLLSDMAPLLFDEDTEIVVYCSNTECTASETAAKILLRQGFTRVLDYTGGLQDWIDADLPIVHRHLPEEEQAA